MAHKKILLCIFAAGCIFGIAAQIQCQHERDEIAAGRNCERACRGDGTCRKQIRHCICDGRCGPVCLRKTCPPLAQPGNGSVVIDPIGRFVGSEATYSCDNGFELVGNVARTCQANQTWSGEDPNCQKFTGPLITAFGGTDRRYPQTDGSTQAEVRSEIDAVNYLSGRNWIPAGQASELVDLEDLLRNFQMYTGVPVTGILDQATKAKMNSPQCGNPDFGEGGFTLSVTRKKRYTHLESRWPHELTWYLENGTPDLNIHIVRSEMIQAFQHWADVTPLTFREVSSNKADIIVKFAVRDHGDGNSFDGPGRVLAHAFKPGSGRGGDIHFDDDEHFTTSTGINLLQVAVHEVGHSLGMGHSSDANAIMAPFYIYRANFTLGTDDINGIQALYGENRHVSNEQEQRCPNPGEANLVETFAGRDFTPLNEQQIFREGDFITSRCQDPKTQKFRGSVTRFCEGGEWSGDPAECEPTNFVFSVVNTVIKNVTENGTIIVYPVTGFVTINCKLNGFQGYVTLHYQGRTSGLLSQGRNRLSHRIHTPSPSNSGRYWCESNGRSHSITVLFKAINCPPPSEPSNWEHSRKTANRDGSLGYIFTETLSLRCPRGYTSSNPVPNECTYHGTWSNMSQRCIRI